MAYFVQHNISYLPGMSHWPSLSGSNVARGEETPLPRLAFLKKPNP